MRNTKVSFIGLGSHTAAPLLYSYVTEHPEYAGTLAPTHFFSVAEVFAGGVGWYEAQFVTNKTRIICGELAPDYLTTSQAAGLIARTYPNAKLFAVIEDPLVSVRVEYIEAIRSGKVHRKTTSLREFLVQHPEVLQRARYGRQLVHYFSYYAPTDLLVFLAKDVRNDVLAAVKRVYQHCGLLDTFVPVSLRHLVVEEEDEKKKPGFIKRRIMALKRLIKAGYGVLSRLAKPKEIATETAAELARRLPLEPELETKLREYFREDVRQLSALLHRNLLVEWGFEDLA